MQDNTVDIVLEDEKEYLRLLFDQNTGVEDLEQFNQQLLSRQLYHWGLILVKMLDLRKRHKIKLRVKTKSNGKLRWRQYEELLNDANE